MESEHEAEIQALKYKVEDLESELRDLKTAFRDEVDDRKDLDRQLRVSKTKIESLTQSLEETNQKLQKAGDSQWLDEPNHPKDGSERWYWIRLAPDLKPFLEKLFTDAKGNWVYRSHDFLCYLSRKNVKVMPIQEPT